jgi:hypothetical protein
MDSPGAASWPQAEASAARTTTKAVSVRIAPL